jgi:predicted nucleic acid-binding protein
VLRIPGNQAIVPAFFHQEILNALLAAERRGRITSVATQEFLADFLTMAFSPETPGVRRLPAIERLSRKHRLTAYDASYLEIAIRVRFPIASFDAALVKSQPSRRRRPVLSSLTAGRQPAADLSAQNDIDPRPKQFQFGARDFADALGEKFLVHADDLRDIGDGILGESGQACG